MAQVLEFKLPDLGEGLTEALIVTWMVQVGDVVTVDQPVVEVETAKAMVEVPCPYAGVVTARYGEEGTELPVGAPLLTVAVGPTDGVGSASAEGSGNVLVGYGTAEPPARRRRVRPSVGGVAVPGGRGRAGVRDTGGGTEAAPSGATRAGDGRGVTAIRASAEVGAAAVGAGSWHGLNGDAGDGPVPVISPLVRRLARQGGLDLRELTGSGPEGLILRADVEDALRVAAVQGRTAAGSHADVYVGEGPVPVSGGTRIPLKGLRGTVADKLTRSRREIPDATCWVDADATELMRARAAMNGAGVPKISLLALLARICTAALAKFPELNSRVDVEAREVVLLDAVHLGFAAQTPRGLVVPVVRDAHARNAEGLSAEFSRLTEAARTGGLKPAELSGGTFTLNNYGVFGVDGSTPIINHPEAAMLGVGRIVPKPWVHEGELAARQVVQLSLTFDHRVCDGGTAGGFLRYVADCVEQPAVLLRTL
ncbi:dihydrolipoamide acetyltransferase family protein [Streptomyces acidiscabies]|uniref:dihydrolipoamide acetyltransferase family protein n=1 Tax=Streptomyces acidiscabies TaxID=42234 RepID=UPI00073F44E2|nr:dihydrolipoamide acetyltransferase family protein [Streptomyces acidiscabies]GAQ53802.1 dihydrolipoyllysine-residue acetyltransferase component of pyruvate dehydrogenase complex [Streptomyces acidiscabies]